MTTAVQDSCVLHKRAELQLSFDPPFSHPIIKGEALSKLKESAKDKGPKKKDLSARLEGLLPPSYFFPSNYHDDDNNSRRFDTHIALTRPFVCVYPRSLSDSSLNWILFSSVALAPTPISKRTSG